MDEAKTSKAKKAAETVEYLKSEALTKDKDSPRIVKRVTFEHDDIEYTVRQDCVFDAQVMEWMRTAPDKAVQKCVGDTGWKRFTEKHTDDEGFATMLYLDSKGEPEPDSPLLALIGALNDAVDPTRRP